MPVDNCQLWWWHDQQCNYTAPPAISSTSPKVIASVLQFTKKNVPLSTRPRNNTDCILANNI
eukprot:scaffold39444_cov58-Attheya_sp.AAC.2